MAKEIKKRDRQATMQKLLDAALEVFSELGFDGATTKAVALKANVTESLIMKYFGSKRGLLLALFEDFAAKRAEAEKIPYPPGKTIEEEIAHFMTRQMEMTLATKEFTRIILGHASVDETMRKELNRKVSLDWHPVLKERLKQYREKGEVPAHYDIDAIVFTLGFQSFSAMYVGHMLLEMPPEEIRHRIMTFAQAYAAGLRALAQSN